MPGSSIRFGDAGTETILGVDIKVIQAYEV